MNDKTIDKLVKIINLLDSIEDERFGPMVYKKLKEYGYTSEQWRRMSKAQAYAIIRKREIEENKHKNVPKETSEKEVLMKPYTKGLTKEEIEKKCTGITSSGEPYKGKFEFKGGYQKPSFNDNDMAYDMSQQGTLDKYTDIHGEFIPERKAIHEEIIDKFFEGKSKPEKQTYTFLGGGAAAGKSTTVKANKLERDDNIRVDCDSIKERLPEYNPKHVENIHEESSAVAKQIKSIAVDNGYSVVDDGTGDGSIESMQKKIRRLKQKGMPVNGIYVTCPLEDALNRNKLRRRSVIDDVVKTTHKKVSEILPEIASEFDDLKLYLNIQGQKTPVLIATGGNGKPLTATKGNEQHLKEFLDKKNIETEEDLKTKKRNKK